MLRKLFLFYILLVLSKFSIGQTAISVYSQGSMIEQVAEADSQLYIATLGRGVVVYNMVTGTYRNMDISNSPMVTNQVYTIQAFSGDTQVVSNSWEDWLVTGGFWTSLYNNYNNLTNEFIVGRSNDSRIFGLYNNNIGPLYEFVNGAFQLVTDSFVQGYNFREVAWNSNNDLYFSAEGPAPNFTQYGFKYTHGNWTLVPDTIYDSILGQEIYISGSFTANNKNFVVATANNTVYHIYEQDSTGWQRIPFPNNSNLTVDAAVTDTAGAILFFYGISISQTIGNQTYDSVYTYVWNSTTQQSVQLPYNVFPSGEGQATQIFGYNGNFFIPDVFYGMQIWNEATNTAISAGYSNVCVDDYLLGNSEPGQNCVVEKNDTFYIVGADGALYMMDTSFTNCHLLATTPSGETINASICKDNYNNIWLLDNAHNRAKNLTTGDSVNLPNAVAWVMFVYDSLIWTGYSGTFQLSLNGVLQPLNNSYAGYFTCMDKYGNLWGDYDLDATSQVMRLDKSGNNLLVKSWNYGSDQNSYYPEVSMDHSGNAWILTNDTLTRYSGDAVLTTYSIVKPHTSNAPFQYFNVFDSTEMVLVSQQAIEYYKNGVWKYYDAKFSARDMAYSFSFHDHRLIFFTEFDGIIEYNLDGNFDNSGDHVGGIVFNDLNGNRIQDSLDVGLTNVPVMVNNNICTSNSFGQYGLDVSNGNYIIKLQTPPYFISYPDSYSISLNDNVVDTLNFACTAPQLVNDLSLNLTANPFVIAYGGDLFTTVRNNGTGIANPVVTLNYDTSLVLNFTGAAIISQAPGTVSFQMATLYPLEETTTVLQFSGPTNIDTAIWIYFQATAYPLVGDTTPHNNTDTLSVFTIGSYDPNYKAVQPQGAGIYNSVDTNQTLTYTIGFQNTGTAAAINIIIVDTLDRNLDLSTFKYISSSNPNTYQLWGNVLTVTFKNVNLPDSSASGVASHGFFKFSINPIHGVPVNEPVINEAYIYFDFNSPVVTNPVMVSFGPPVYTSISDPFNNPLGSVAIWPQPCSDQFTVYLSQQIQMPAILRLYDLSGKLVLEKSVENNREAIWVNNLSSGVYILNVTDNANKAYRFKCVKTR